MLETTVAVTTCMTPLTTVAAVTLVVAVDVSAISRGSAGSTAATAFPGCFPFSAASAFAIALSRVLTVILATFPAAFASGALVGPDATVASEMALSFAEVAGESSSELGYPKLTESVLQLEMRMLGKACRNIHTGEELESEGAGKLLSFGKSLDPVVGRVIDA